MTDLDIRSWLRARIQTFIGHLLLWELLLTPALIALFAPGLYRSLQNGSVGSVLLWVLKVVLLVAAMATAGWYTTTAPYLRRRDDAERRERKRYT